MTKWHEAILSKLDGYSGFDIDFNDDHIIVSCNNAESFDISFQAFGSEFQVSFDGWHEHFENEEEALNCFTFGLSQECRLKVTKRGAMECSWTVQAWQGDTWVNDTTTGLILIPFWRPKQIEYRHNLIIAKGS
ncbi:hypothetical protein KDD17_04940 [Sulfitobacter albidus]|uniref:Uncharacterized protein n=1 Tax=Sulfitobacter albidus TaxID=2829501 RepID=A0A975JFP2_9RHOB|nr:hypothetical protein [Sulfitobacter albidus]QUJ77351.1 hypothetical protein KDD17_04940 [Sulfitobacter albidus]